VDSRSIKWLAVGGGIGAAFVIAVGIALLLAGYQQGLLLCYVAGASGLAFVTVVLFTARRRARDESSR
jgi:heme A synthase